MNNHLLLGTPVSYRLPYSRMQQPAAWNFAEIVATKFDEEGQPTSWAIRESGSVLANDGEWEMEPLPSDRDDEYLRRTRWPTAEQAAEFALLNFTGK